MAKVLSRSERIARSRRYIALNVVTENAFNPTQKRDEKGRWVKIPYYKGSGKSGVVSFQLSEKAQKALEDNEWIWSNDLMTAIDGKRKLAIGSDTMASRTGLKSKINSLKKFIKKRGFKAEVIEGKFPVYWVISKTVSHSDEPSLRKLLKKYTGLFETSQKENQLLGEAFGYPAKAIEAFYRDKVLSTNSLITNARKKPINPLRSDPSRTMTIRRGFEEQLLKRFSRLQKEITKLLVDDKALGITVNVFCPTGEGGGVDPTCSPKGKKSTSTKPKLVISTDHKALIKSNFPFSWKDLPGLVGAQPGATVRVQNVYVASSEYGETYVSVAVDHPDFEMRRSIYKDRIVNDSIEVKSPGKGIGTKIFFDQVSIASAKGFKTISTSATKGHEVNGYYTWARLGYDAKIPGFRSGRFVDKEASEVIPGATLISDLMKSEKGREWWKSQGVSFEGEFDLTPGSLSMKVLSEYVKQKGLTTNEFIEDESLTDEKILDFIWDQLGSDLVANAPNWSFDTPQSKIDNFEKWIISKLSETMDEKDIHSGINWWQLYIERAYKLGAGRTFDEVRKRGAIKKPEWYQGTKEQFLSSSFNNPVSVDRLKVLVGRTHKALKGLTDSMRTQLTQELTDGLIQGKSPKEIAKNISKRLGISKNRGLVIARTECFPGETIVDGAEVISSFSRLYSGDMIEIKTSSGRKFSATPNHPMLTTVGWVSAGMLNNGHYLIRSCGGKNPELTTKVNINRGPTSLSEIHNSLSTVETCERVIGHGPDFHGDGFNSQIDIFSSDLKLRYGQFTPITQELFNNEFSFSGHRLRSGLTFCRCCSHLLPINKTVCLVCGSQLNTPLIQDSFNDISTHFKKLTQFTKRLPIDVSGNDFRSLQIVPQLVSNPTLLPGDQLSPRVGSLDSGLSNDISNSGGVTVEQLSDLMISESGIIQFDNVTSVTSYGFSGHVYNLETVNGYYTIAGGYYTGNCVRSHAEGQLASLRALGVNEIGVDVEFTTSRNPCPICNKLKGKVFTLDQAEGVIPVHPNCLCAFLPRVSSVPSPQKEYRRKSIESSIQRNVR